MSPFKNKFEWVRAFSAPNSGLSSTQHHVALMLADKMSMEGHCFVTHAQLSFAIRKSERTVCSALTALAEMEWIERNPGAAGRATTYRMARPARWTPPPADAPPAARHTKRHGVNPAEHEAAHQYLTAIYIETGVHPERANENTVTTRRLLGVLRRHLTHMTATSSEHDKVRKILVETSLESANDPAAVLLTRYKKALRHYPHHRPTRPVETTLNVTDLVGTISQALTMPKDLQGRP